MVVRKVCDASMRKMEFKLKVWNPRLRVGTTQLVITHGVGRACRISGLLMRNRIILFLIKSPEIRTPSPLFWLRLFHSSVSFIP